jgi:hypothetical protein
MFYLLVLPSLAMSILVLFNLLSLKKHDVVLFRFCQIRRDAIKLIAARGAGFDRTSYHSIRNLLECLNVMTHNYEGCKTHIFNIRRLEQTFKHYKHTTRQVDKIQIPDDAEIVMLHKRFRYAMLEAFLVYTPLIRSEILARLLLNVIKLFSLMGIKSLASAGNYLSWLIEEMKNTNNHSNHNNPLTA